MSEIKELQKKVHNLNVMVVDDEIEVLDATVEFFKKFFQSVDKASNGKEALELYRSKDGDYDLIISDARMPVMNGWKFFKELRDNNTKASLILMTGSTDEEDRDETLCDHIFIKPIKLNTVIEFLKELVTKKGL